MKQLNGKSMLIKPLKLAILPLLFMPAFSTMAQTCKTTITPTTDHFLDNNNGTVSDPKTGLIWKKCSEGQSYNSGTNSCDNAASTYNWAAALQQTQDVNAATSGENLGQTDWRVPNINELASIAELSCFSPAINLSIFPSTPSNGYWSSSPRASYVYGAWIVNFDDGYDGTLYKNYYPHVRLVRSGQ